MRIAVGADHAGYPLKAGAIAELRRLGHQVIDLGTNVSAEKFIQAIKEHRPAAVGLSALLTTTMREMRQTLEALRRSGVADGVKTVIGGAPVTQDFADTIGADGWAPDAPAAVATIKRLIGTG